MFYEEIRIGQVTELGSATFSRKSILAYAQQFDPRILEAARDALRASMKASGEVLPELGVSPGFRDMRWPHPVLEGDAVSFSMQTVSKRETSKPKWGLVANAFRSVNQRGEDVLIFSSLVLAARRTAA